MEDECNAIQAATRLISLVEDGCSIDAMKIAVNRSGDEISLLVNLGIIEDLFYSGIDIGSQQ